VYTHVTPTHHTKLLYTTTYTPHKTTNAFITQTHIPTTGAAKAPSAGTGNATLPLPNTSAGAVVGAALSLSFVAESDAFALAALYASDGGGGCKSSRNGDVARAGTCAGISLVVRKDVLNILLVSFLVVCFSSSAAAVVVVVAVGGDNGNRDGDGVGDGALVRVTWSSAVVVVVLICTSSAFVTVATTSSCCTTSVLLSLSRVYTSICVVGVDINVCAVGAGCIIVSLSASACVVVFGTSLLRRLRLRVVVVTGLSIFMTAGVDVCVCVCVGVIACGKV